MAIAYAACQVVVHVTIRMLSAAKLVSLMLQFIREISLQQRDIPFDRNSQACRDGHYLPRAPLACCLSNTSSAKIEQYAESMESLACEAATSLARGQ